MKESARQTAAESTRPSAGDADALSARSGTLSARSGTEGEHFPATLHHTLAASFEQTGVGLHSGLPVTVRVMPAPDGAGRYFVRTDLPASPAIAAAVDRVSQTRLSTELTENGASVRTVEHLLAALSAMGVDNARIELDGPEIPLLDGSALPWVEAIAQAGLCAQSPKRDRVVIPEPVWVYQGDAFVAAIPSPELRFSYGIDFELPAIGNQWHSWAPGNESLGESFREAIAPARTFGLAHQIDQLRHSGLIKGGSLDNALVCGADGWINPPLRFSNEPVRHKLLDLVGDLSLVGVFPQAHYLAYKASHQLHTRLAQQLVSLIPVL
ncbi:MAG TPA: UDP-3-O-acyl-N-acetylglucosamine deacetylase [Chroococcidiopsis sp.]